MRAPRHYLLLVVYLHSSSKEKRETHISLTNSLLLSSSVLSLFIKKSLFCSSLFSLSFFLQFFVKKMQIHFPLLSKTCKNNSPPQFEDRRKKEKRRKKNLQRIDFFRDEITLSNLSLQKKSSKRRACLHTHACTHTHTLLSLSICKLSEHCCCCCCCELGVFSSSLSLSFLVRKKKGEETEDD